jgi:hypothetical protein
MTRATSRESYRQLVESGALRGKQASALEAVVLWGPATSAEIIDKAQLGENVNLWRARFTELQARGLIVETGTRKCKITGRTALTWEYSGRTKPLDPNKGRGVSKKTLAATLIRICRMTESAVQVIDSNGLDDDNESPSVLEAVKEAREIAARA